MIANCIKLLVWLITFMIVLTVCTKMMTAANTIEAVIGLVIGVLFILLSYKTLFFTGITLKKFKFKSKKEEK